MKIISKYQDYYDSVLAYGHDDAYVYIRKSEVDYFTTNYDVFDDVINNCPEMNSDKYTRIPFVLGFCGQFYVGLKLTYGSYGSYWDQGFAKTFYNFGDLEHYINHIKDRHLRQGEQKRLDGHTRRWSPYGHMTIRERFEMFFDSTFPANDEIFFELGSPVFIITPVGFDYDGQRPEIEGERPKGCNLKIQTNPVLKEIEFFRMLPHHQTFQAIDQYLSGVLGSAHPPMVQISDIHMRDKKGFDEWSFKTLPTKRR